MLIWDVVFTGFIGCIGFMVLWGLGTIRFSGLQGLGLRAGVLSEPFSRLRGPKLFTKTLNLQKRVTFSVRGN